MRNARKIFFLLASAALARTALSAEEPRGRPSFLRKTGRALEGVSNKVTEPIRDPKKVFRTYFDFNPEIQSGRAKNYNVLPLFVSSPERGQGFGLKYAQASLLKKDDVVRFQAVQTLKNKSGFAFRYEFPPSFLASRPHLGAELEVTYENYAKFYYGLGNRSQKEDESQYTPEVFTATLPLLYGLSPEIAVGLSLHYENSSITHMDANGILPRDLPRLIGKDGTRLYTTGVLARWDSRNSKTNPSRGIFAEGQLEYSKKLLGSETDFNRRNFEIRAFRPFLDRKEHVFCARLYMDYRTGDVPFDRLPELGGIFFNRGLIEGRFRDALLLSGNWEYRLKIYERLHWAFFVDAGNVYPEFGKVTLSGSKLTGGSGMRYYVPPGNLLLARVDAGYSTEGLNVYLTFDHPF